MIKVIFVCLGNICRSPMAKYVFLDLIKQKGIEANFIVDSAATSNEEVGNGLYDNAREKLEEKNIEYDNHIARQLTKADYEKFDYIIGMEDENIYNVLRIIGEDNQRKVFKLLDFSNNPRDISDPWYTRNFEKAYADIKEGCESFLQFLLEKE